MGNYQNEIAIIGMSGRFPQASNLFSFYRNLKEKRDSVRVLSESRKRFSKLDSSIEYQLCGYLDRIDYFDHHFFNISKREAEYMDPAHRILLELACNAIESSGYSMQHFRGSNTAVYLGGKSFSNYYELLDDSDPTVFTGNSSPLSAGRLSYLLDLRGPAMVIDTACSSSLVAVHEACQKLSFFEVDCALAGGVSINTMFPTADSGDFLGISSTDGKCRPFDALANGTVSGEGGGFVLLKRLTDAIRDRDCIRAIIKASGINHDGSRSNGITAPSPDAQTELIKSVWLKADIDPETIRCIEAHGTGTKLGDPIEFQALSSAFKYFTSRKKICALSSVKSNIGHLDNAAGIAGLLKLVLALENKTLLPSLHFKNANPFLDYSNSALYINDDVEIWNEGAVRRCAVSSFGLSGTNCHILLEEPPAFFKNETKGADECHTDEYFLRVSAKSKKALKEYLKSIAEFFDQKDSYFVQNALHVLNTGRDNYDFRLALAEPNRNTLIDSLNLFISSLDNDSNLESHLRKEVILLFSDVDIDSKLIEALAEKHAEIKAVLAEVTLICRNVLNVNLYKFILHWGLYRQLITFGVTSNTVFGNGIGKITTKLISGKITLSEAITLIQSGQVDVSFDEERFKVLVSQFSFDSVVFIEIGPRGILLDCLLKIFKHNTIHHTNIIALENGPSFRQQVFKLYGMGIDIEWEKFYSGQLFSKMVVPQYPFEENSCWPFQIEGESSVKVNDGELYNLVWETYKPQDIVGSEVSGKVLIFIDSEGVGFEVVKMLAGRNSQVVIASTFGPIAQKDCNEDFFQVNDLESYQVLRDELIKKCFFPCSIIHLASCFDEPWKLTTQSRLEVGLFSNFHIVKSFHEEFSKNQISSYSIFTSNARKVNADDLIIPEFSTLHGFVPSFKQEYNSVDIKIVDVIKQESNPRELSRIITDEFLRIDEEIVKCYRENNWYKVSIVNFEALSIESARTIFSNKGAYVITGGSSGIGLELAAHICSENKLNVILIGRRSLPPKEEWQKEVLDPISDNSILIARLMQMQKSGSAVEYYSCDISNLEQLSFVIQDVKNNYGDIKGVFHLAGVPGGKKMASHSLGTFEEPLVAKIYGSLNLVALLEHTLDFFVSFSSNNSFLGVAGNSNYAAGNMFLDNYSHILRRKGIKAMTISWGGWDETGMLHRFLDKTQQKQRDLFSVEEGLSLLNKALYCDVDYIIAAKNPGHKLENVVESSKVLLTPELDFSLLGNTMWTSTQNTVGGIWKSVLKADNLGLWDDFFDIGGHSLNGTQVINRIEIYFKIKIEFEILFDCPTIFTLSEYVDKMRFEEEASDSYSNCGIDPVPLAPYYDISEAQKRLWVLEQFDEVKGAYNMPGAYVGEGHLNREILDISFKMLVERHESLRTVFIIVKNVPKQKVIPIKEFSFHIDYIAREELDIYDEEVDQIIFDDMVLPFDISIGPLLRLKVVLLKNSKCLMMLNMHHIISDGWSNHIFVKEIFIIYNALLDKKKPVLPDLKIQYKDYAAWQNRLIQSPSGRKAKQFWLNKFSNELPVMNMEADFARPKIQTYNGQVLSRVLTKEFLVSIKEFNLNKGVSLFMTLLSGVYALVNRYTGQRDLIIGTPIAGRDNRDLENLIGFFINILPMRINIDDYSNFDSLVDQVKQTSIEAYDNQIYPYNLLLEDLDFIRDRSRNPLFDISVVLQNTEVNHSIIENEQSIHGLKISTLPQGQIYSKYDLSFEFHEQGDSIFFRIEYNTDLFKRERIERMMDHYVQLLESALVDSRKPLEKLDMLKTTEKSELLIQFNDTDEPDFLDSTLQDLLYKGLKANGEKIALVDFRGTYTYNQLNNRSDKLANFLLKTTRASNNSLVAAIVLKNSVETIVAILAVIKAGGTFVPIDINTPYERMRYILNDSKVEIVISQISIVDNLNQLQWQCQSFSTYICVDTYDFLSPIVSDQSKLVYSDNILENSDSEGGFLTKEIPDNLQFGYRNVLPYLTPNSKVLEICCCPEGSMVEIASAVKSYCGINTSTQLIVRMMAEVKENNLFNVKLYTLDPSDIGLLSEEDFDVVIINIGSRHFPTIRYWSHIFEQIASKMSVTGILFLSDIYDIDLRDDLVDELKKNIINDDYKRDSIKTDWSKETFLSKKYFNDLCLVLPFFKSFIIAEKLEDRQNKLLAFQYDVILHVNKDDSSSKYIGTRFKWQFTANALERDLGDATSKKCIPTDYSYILYTSGSTGFPKGVPVRNDSICNYLGWACMAYFKNGEYGNMPLITSIAADLTLTSIFCPLLMGKQIYIYDEQAIDVVMTECLNNFAIDTIKLTPSHILLINYLPSIVYSGLRNVIVGGEELRNEHLDILRSLNPDIKIYNEYGPTECTVGCTFSEIASDIINIGKPIANTKVFLLDKNLQPVPIGNKGEIYITGICVSDGYLNNSPLTSNRFVINPFESGRKMYKTGDFGRWTSDGNIEFLGRVDEQIKIRGHRVEVSEIEEVVRKYPGVHSCFILKESSSQQKEVQLICGTYPKINIDTTKLKIYLNSYLPAYMLPAFFFEIDQIPYLPSGKTDYRKLYEDFQNGRKVRTSNYVAINKTESALLEIWEEVLGRRDITMEDNFFELGGHSLKATMIVARIWSVFKKTIGIRSIFMNPTIPELAKLVLDADDQRELEIPLLPVQPYYNLSHNQKQLWAIDQFNLGQIAYNMFNCFMIEGDLNIHWFKKSIVKIIERHEILRTNFIIHDGEPKQRIRDFQCLDFDIGFIDLQSFPDKHHKLEYLKIQELTDPFDLENDNLIRIKIISFEKGKHVFLLTLHHIISDGWSMKVFGDELIRFYKMDETEIDNVDNLQFQYKEYAEWHNSQLYGVNLFKLREYWHNQFLEPVSPLNLPIDLPRPKLKSFNGDIIVSTIPVDEFRLIQKIGQENNATLFMTLLTFVNTVLYKLTNQSDIILGTPLAGRMHKEFESQLGNYLNTVPLRTRMYKNDTFEDLLAEVKQVVIGAFEHQIFPFDLLLDDLNIRTDQSRSPLFDVLIMLQNIDDSTILNDTGNLSFIPISSTHKSSKFDLSFIFEESQDYLEMAIEYNSDIYKRETVQKIETSFLSLIKTFGENPRLLIFSQEPSENIRKVSIDFMKPLNEI